MSDTKKMLRAIINGQSALKGELLNKIDGVDKKVDQLDEKVDGLGKKIDKVEKNLTIRIDKLGSQLAYLEDDAPPWQTTPSFGSRLVHIPQVSS